jgi:hypothetical protein
VNFRKLLATIVIGIALAGSLTLAGTGPTRADFNNWLIWTYSGSGCGNLKDPLNFFYQSEMGSIDAATSITYYQLGWTWDFIASDQKFYNLGWPSGNRCRNNDYNRASGVISPRNHTRLKQGPDYQCPYICKNTASPMHHEIPTIPCGDVADTFNGPRDYAKNTLDPNYFLQRSYLGNTLAIKQCNGTYTAGDGYAWVVLARR